MSRRNRMPSERDEVHLNEGGSQAEAGEGSTHASKKTRGATKLNDAWKLPSGERIQVEMNKDNQPVGKNAVTFASFIGLIARNAEYLPLCYDRWTKIPPATRARAIEVLKQKFDYPAVLDADWVNKSMHEKWRDYKVELKAEHYDEERTVAENTRVVPKDVVCSDWEFLCHFWSTPEGKKMAERDRVSQDAQDVLHTSGGTSFVRHRAIMDEERGGDQHGNLDPFDATHMKSQGEFAPLQSTAKARYAQLSSGTASDSSITPVDIVQFQHQGMVDNMSPEHHCRVRGKGLGPTPSRSRASSSTQPDPRDEKLRSLEIQISELKDKVAILVRETIQNPNYIPRQHVDTLPTGSSQVNQEGEGECNPINNDMTRHTL